MSIEIQIFQIALKKKRNKGKNLQCTFILLTQIFSIECKWLRHLGALKDKTQRNLPLRIFLTENLELLFITTIYYLYIILNKNPV